MIPEHILSKIEAGNKLYVKIIDELPDGDGTVLFSGIDTVRSIEGNGYFLMDKCQLFATPEEIKRVYLKKHLK